MTRPIICSSCKKNIVIQFIMKKTKTILKHVVIVEKERRLQKKQPPLTPNNEDNVSTKSSTQQSQSSCFNTLEIITNNTNTTQFYNIDNDNTR